MGFAKPIDVGTGRVCASSLPDGSWLSIGAVHPVHGLVELSGMPAFDERQRGDPVAARRHRELMASGSSAFLEFEDGAVSHVSAEAPAGAHWIRLVVRLASGASLRFRGRLDRPALAEITETHPPAPTGARTRLAVEGPLLRVAAPELPATAVVEADRGSWRLTDAGGAVLGLSDATQAKHLAITVRLSAPDAGPPPEPSGHPGDADSAAGAPTQRSLVVPDRLEPVVERITSGAIAYVRGCTALAAGPGERTILTDHRLLPLSWTRDAYWQALLLLVAEEAGLVDDGTAIVEDHLRWLWLRTERPDGAWVRSHHANGRRKDLPFQADQQLYPMLELADYAARAGRLPRLPSGADDGERWASLVSQAWVPVEASRDPLTGLMRSDENASDDPAPLPLIAPSQILGWYTARRLLALDAALELGLDTSALASFAEEMRRGLSEHVAVDGADGPMWAYAVDGRGEAASFHDAGDLPSVLAPLWGFCSVDDATWRATMRFAFSPANPGYATGAFGGLGSPHTAGSWPLGDLQEWVFASLTADPERAERLLDRIAVVAAEDGMLPEAYDPDDGSFVARHWFAWPGAFLGALWLLDRRGSFGDRLSALAA